jgi:ankyrin repeat protein
MRAQALITSCAAALLLSAAAFGAGSPVADAAMRGDRAAVRTLLQQKSDVNVPQPDGATAIQWAAYNNDLAMADMLIAAGADVKLANNDGATPMRLAAINGSGPMLEKLIRAGADPNERDMDGNTPLMFAARNGNVDALKVLVEHKADVNAKENLRGTTPLMWAAAQSHPEAIRFLIQHGADVSAVSSPDTKGHKAYLAPSVKARERSAQGAGGLRAQFRAFGRPNGLGGGPGRGPGAASGQRGAATGPADASRRGPDAGAAGKAGEDEVAAADRRAAFFAFGMLTDKDGGGLTPLVFSARQGDLASAKELIAAGADVNQKTRYGWTPLLTATQNRHYKLGAYLLDHGADPNIANNGGWSPLYIATDNRNIEGGDYPVRQADMDHLDYIKLLLDHGANPNQRVCGVDSTPTVCKGDSTETRTIFTMQWLYEDGATPFLRAAQSGDVTLMKLLLAHGADPQIKTQQGVTALSAAAGIGWVEGVTFEWSPEENLEAVKMCLNLGIDPNAADQDGRAALHGAAHKGRIPVVQALVDGGARLDQHDHGSRDTVNGAMKGVTWEPVQYAEGLVRVGVQSAIAHPEVAAYMKNLMKEKGIPIPPDITSSICLTKGLKGCE